MCGLQLQFILQTLNGNQRGGGGAGSDPPSANHVWQMFRASHNNLISDSFLTLPLCDCEGRGCSWCTNWKPSFLQELAPLGRSSPHQDFATGAESVSTAGLAFSRISPTWECLSWTWVAPGVKWRYWVQVLLPEETSRTLVIHFDLQLYLCHAWHPHRPK